MTEPKSPVSNNAPRSSEDSASSQASIHHTTTTKSERDEYPMPETEDMAYTKTQLDRPELARSVTKLSSAMSQTDMPESDIRRLHTILELITNDERVDPASSAFNFNLWARALMHKLERAAITRPRVNITFKNLKVTADPTDVRLHKTVGSTLMTPFGFASIHKHRHTPRRIILNDFNGHIKSGEMLLVLGRPGSGCTTFLKSITANLEGAEIAKESIITYNGVPQSDFHLRGEILFNHENECHFPHLTVAQTLNFAAAARAPRQNIQGLPREEYCQYMIEVVMTLFGLSHARNTSVGNDFVRGISGGERKRVSIAEMAVSGALAAAWDNASRGLDSATAFEFINSLRTSASITGTTHAVAVYQASQSMYDLFDKVIVLYEGHQIYFGPASEACAYFEEMGWQRPARMVSGDFLTSITNPKERRARPGLEKSVPRTPEEFEKYWQNSRQCCQCLFEVTRAEKHGPEGEAALEEFQAFHNLVQAKHTRSTSPYRINFPGQIKICMIRAFQRLRNQPAAAISKLVAQVVQALIVGSIFYGTPQSTDAFFARGSNIFTVVLVNTLMSVAEIPALFQQRPIVEKHVHYALYHPSAEALGSVIADLPVKLTSSGLFGIILYFLAGLRTEASNFFIFLLLTTLTMLTMSGFFRTIAAAAKTNAQAMSMAGISILAIIIYTGFTIQRKYMKPWLKWVSYVNPIAYVFEALLTNEVHGTRYLCAPQSFVPPYGNGTGAACAAPGAQPGERFVSGDDWVSSAYGYSYSHLWRNLGILIAYMVFFYFTYMACSEFNYKLESKGTVLVFRRGHTPKNALHGDGDVEASSSGSAESAEMNEKSEMKDVKLNQRQPDIFTWRNVSLEVPVKEGKRCLLDNVSGWVKPGTMTALMGTSGAGKTTLLDSLAQRVRTGVLTGDMFVNTRPINAAFPRRCGYCQQQDVHLETSTVREALQFSAMLRQPKSTTKSEKVAYVEEVVKMLGMEDFAEAIVGTPGEGLNIEQRKLLTIGVELAAKPSLLLFLDEPTSGLDSQSSWSIITLLRKLADSGQAVLATIHQPSAILFQQFDRLLFLAKGGRTVFFGDIGENSRTLLDYFESSGARKCDDEENPAEYILEVVGGKKGPPQDWPTTWNSSSQAQAVQDEITRIRSQAVQQSSSAPVETGIYAESWTVQFKLVLHRVYQQYWRTPQYIFGKVILCTSSALFVGFSFWLPGTSQTDMQNSIFAIFMLLTIFTPLVQQIMPRFTSTRSLYETRERPSRTFSSLIFITTSILAEIPYQLLCAILVFLSWYFSVFGAHQSAKTQATMLAFAITFYMFTSSFAFLIIAALPDAATAGPIVALLFSLMILFSGVLQKPSSLPGFWRFMWRVSPFTYVLGGWAGAGLTGRVVDCAANELAVFNAPSNMTCEQYLQPYFEGGALGKLLNPNATMGCEYCPLQNADQFLALSEIYPDQVYRNLGISYVYVVFNVFAAVGLYYLFRVRKVSPMKGWVKLGGKLGAGKRNKIGGN